MHSGWRFSSLAAMVSLGVVSAAVVVVLSVGGGGRAHTTKPAFAILQATSNKGWGGLKQLLARLLPPGLLGEEWLAGGDGDSSQGEDHMLLSPRGPQRAARRGVGGILQGMKLQKRMSVQS